MTKLRYYIWLFVAILAMIPIYLQCQNREESISALKEELNNADEIDKAGILIDIANYFRYTNYDSALHYAILADHFSQRYQLTDKRISSLLLIGRNSNNIGDPEYSKSIYDLATKIALESGNPKLIAQVYISYSIYYTSKFNFTKVLTKLDSAVFYINKYDIKELKPKVYFRIASLYNTLDELPVTNRYIKLTRYALDNYDDNEIRVKINHMEGMVLLEENKPVKSLEHLQNALKISKELNRVRLEQTSYRRLAVYYIETKDFEKANKYIDSSLAICDELGLRIERSALLTYKAHLAWMELDYHTALDYNLKALEIRESTGHRAAISSSMLNIGGNYIKLKDFKNAECYINRGLEIAKNQNALIYIRRGYNLLSQVYELTGRYKKSLEYFKTRTMYHDSIYHIQSTEKTLFFSNLYEEEREKREVEARKLDKASNNLVYLILMIILLLAIIIILFRTNYIRKKQHKEILKLSKVIETTDQGVLISDGDGNIDYFNNGTVKLLNYPGKTEFVGKKINDIVDFKSAVMLDQVVIPRLLEKGTWSGEINFLTKDGHQRVGFLTCSQIANSSTKNLFVAIFSDISERKRYEQALKHSQEELQETVETQEKMFSIIAHDLTGPFNTILGFTNELASNFDSYEKKDLIKFSQIINESSKNTYNLLNNLLHWSRTKLGRIKINKIEVDLYPIVEQNINLLSPTAANKAINMINNVAENADVLADGSTLDIVLRNLISNAIKFTPKDGTVTINFTESEKDYKIEVSDTGIGINPDDINNLFRESKARSTPGTENEKGTGLGLIVCNELVSLNNGNINIESAIGIGTTFTITLPKDQV